MVWRFLPKMRSLLLVCLFAIACTATNWMPENGSDNKLGHLLLKETVDQLNKLLQKPFYYVLYDLNQGEPGVHTGKFHQFTLTLAPSSCWRGIHHPVNTMQECKLTDEEPFQKCTVELMHQSLTNAPTSTVLLSHVCSPTLRRLPDNLELLGFSVPHDAQQLYSKFKDDHNKQYTLEEDARHFSIFKSNLLLIQFLNTVERGSAVYGITPFSDLTQNEFKRNYLAMKWNGIPDNMYTTGVLSEKTPTSFDWRTKGAVTAVRNQGSCGSCWAFSAVENIEGQWFLKKGKLVSLSEQQLLDCDKQDEGCQGGLPSQAYRSIIRSGGLMSSDDYPYEAKEEAVCHFKPKNAAAYINDSVELPKDESKLADWLAKNGPISVGLNAFFLQFYFGGIVQPFNWLCQSALIDHAVLIVGYGTSSILRRPFWIVKNSWGESWGESGYFRIHRGTGTCGINQVATSAVIK